MTDQCLKYCKKNYGPNSTGECSIIGECACNSQCTDSCMKGCGMTENGKDGHCDATGKCVCGKFTPDVSP